MEGIWPDGQKLQHRVKFSLLRLRCAVLEVLSPLAWETMTSDHFHSQDPTSQQQQARVTVTGVSL